jgi:hypothetical protein
MAANALRKYTVLLPKTQNYTNNCQLVTSDLKLNITYFSFLTRELC